MINQRSVIKGEVGCGIWADPEKDKPLLQIPHVRCEHCQRHFPHPRYKCRLIVLHGMSIPFKSGRVAGHFCGRCNGYVCNRPNCVKMLGNCTNWKKVFDIEEGNAVFSNNPTAVTVAVPESKLWLPPIYDKE